MSGPRYHARPPLKEKLQSLICLAEAELRRLIRFSHAELVHMINQ
jgi:hypothetical protein